MSQTTKSLVAFSFFLSLLLTTTIIINNCNNTLHYCTFDKILLDTFSQAFVLLSPPACVCVHETPHSFFPPLFHLFHAACVPVIDSLLPSSSPVLFSSTLASFLSFFLFTSLSSLPYFWLFRSPIT
ncbi:hypothetical protein BCV70DRAFT_199659 [Testicularia cyperi]|uniref:Uncharacterized protein n=1 Tax=Testicularia cyperi TaxID=1882483 RepID=A0A317XRE8_9BASI|nr:hypothetical protein BCV70DRAFT_199659 [Testicularia cyperi]